MIGRFRFTIIIVRLLTCIALIIIIRGAERNEIISANKTTTAVTMLFCWHVDRVTEYEPIIMVIVTRHCCAIPQTTHVWHNTNSFSNDKKKKKCTIKTKPEVINTLSDVCMCDVPYNNTIIMMRFSRFVRI